MLLVVGLGNPGAEYARQRHNVGYMAVDVIHARHRFGPWKRRFQGDVAEGTLAGDKVMLLKPLTFMNDSGRSVQAAAAFYKLAPKDIVVIHDEVDLPPAKVRLKAGGGSAGHNGLRSVTGALGDDYRRIRIGVGHPGRKEAVPGYVLHDFAKADTKWLVPLLDAIADNAALLAEGKDATLANRIHAALSPEEPDKPPKAKKPDKNGNPPTDGGAAPKGSAAKPAPKKPDKPTKGGTPEKDPGSGADNPPPDKPEGPLARGLRKLFGR